MRLLPALLVALAFAPAAAAEDPVGAAGMSVAVQEPTGLPATDSTLVVVTLGPAGAGTCPTIPVNFANGHVMYCSDGQWVPVGCPLTLSCPEVGETRLLVIRH
jgi:hypothetical protein